MRQEETSVEYAEEYVLNSRGMKLLTCSWLPASQSPRALVFVCHGYAMDCASTMKDTALALAKAGYAVYGLEYEGHGRSQGLPAFIPDFDLLIHDCISFFRDISSQHQNRGLKRFLLGESMGGAVAISIHRLERERWDGAVLVAPMCSISQELKPHPLVISVLSSLTRLIPRWKIVPTKDIFEVGYQEPLKRQLIKDNPLVYKGRPRLLTAHQILMRSLYIEKCLHDVTLPLLILHGADDVVTDPEISRSLYESSASTDKTLKIYSQMWHGLLSGETPFHTQVVFSDILSWLHKRC